MIVEGASLEELIGVEAVWEELKDEEAGLEELTDVGAGLEELISKGEGLEELTVLETESGTVVTILLLTSSSSSLLTKDIFLDFCDLLSTTLMLVWEITFKLELEVVQLIVELLYKLSKDTSNAGEFTGSLKFMLGRNMDSS